MKRSILLSTLIIGAIAAMVTGASFSVFTDSESASGTVTAGTVELDDNSQTTLLLSTGAGCPGPIGSGDTCVMLLDQFGAPSPNNYKINYTGSLDAHVAVSLSVDESVAGCFTVIGMAGSVATGQGGMFLLPYSFPVGGGAPVETIPVQLTATLTGGNECQGATADVTVNAVATED